MDGKRNVNIKREIHVSFFRTGSGAEPYSFPST